MKSKFLTITACLSLVIFLSSCGGGDPKESKEYKELAAKLAAMDSTEKAHVDGYNAVSAAFLSGKTDEFAKFVDANMVDHNEDTMMSHGKKGLEGMIEMAKGMASMQTEMTWVPVSTISKGDYIISWGKMGGKPSDAMCAMIPGAKKGNSYNIDYIEVIKLTNGKATERWGLMDNMTMMSQMTAKK